MIVRIRAQNFTFYYPYFNPLNPVVWLTQRNAIDYAVIERSRDAPTLNPVNPVNPDPNPDQAGITLIGKLIWG
jgi:hypothetical protein